MKHILQGQSDILIRIVIELLKYIERPDDFTGVVAEQFGESLMYTLRAVT